MSVRHIMAKDRPHPNHSDYLGDGLYAYHDGYGVWLTAEDGIRVTDGVYLEPQVFVALQEFLRREAKKWTEEILEKQSKEKV